MIDVQKHLRPLARRVSMMAGRAIVRLITDGDAVQLLQLGALADETLDQVEHVQPYGMTSYPKPGAEAIVLALGGVRGRTVVIMVGDRRFRLKTLVEGEVALYDDQGQVVHLKRDRVKLSSPTLVEVDAPEINLLSDAVQLGATGGKKVVLDGDPVSGGVVHASSTKVTAT